MRTQMREAQLKELQQQRLDERTQRGDALVEKWSERAAGAGIDSLYAENPGKARNLAFVLEAQSRHMKRMSESQLSSAFATAPMNVMKIIRLAYPNSVRGEIFTEVGMQTAKDVLYYLTSVYADTIRGEQAGGRVVESFGSDYPSEETTVVTAGSLPNITADLGAMPVRPFTIKLLGRKGSGPWHPLAQDLGSGVLTNGLSGTALIANTAAFDYNAPNTITINIGADAAKVPDPSTPGTMVQCDSFMVRYALNTEYFASSATSGSSTIGKIQLQLEETTFRARPFPLGVEWNQMVSQILGTTLNVNVEDQVLQGAADEMKKAFDYQALRLAYLYAKSRPGEVWKANATTAGAASEVLHAQSLMKVIYDTGDRIYNELGRGGVSSLFGGSRACNLLSLHNDFEAVKKPSKIGAYKFGTLGDIAVFKAPKEVMGGQDDELVGVWKNEAAELDTAIIYGTLIPLYSTAKLEHPTFYTEQGLAYFGDYKVTNPKYITNLKLDFT